MLSTPPRAVRAHALKNCLAVIAAVNHLVESEVSEETHRRLMRSRNAVHRMLELIDADLRPGCEVLERPDWKIVSAIDVLAAVGARVVDLAATKGVRLEVRAGAGAVRGNLESLVEALGNIVRNAIEMSPSGGPVVVSSFRCVDGGQLWTVRDTGPGIPSHELPNIGRPYFSRRPGGSGLGVAVARDIVESHGGVTQFTPSPGGGTLVSIRLPPAHEI